MHFWIIVNEIIENNDENTPAVDWRHLDYLFCNGFESQVIDTISNVQVHDKDVASRRIHRHTHILNEKNWTKREYEEFDKNILDLIFKLKRAGERTVFGI
jgi:hypothetical protein